MEMTTEQRTACFGVHKKISVKEKRVFWRNRCLLRLFLEVVFHRFHTAIYSWVGWIHEKYRSRNRCVWAWRYRTAATTNRKTEARKTPSSSHKFKTHLDPVSKRKGAAAIAPVVEHLGGLCKICSISGWEGRGVSPKSLSLSPGEQRQSERENMKVLETS